MPTARRFFKLSAPHKVRWHSKLVAQQCWRQLTPDVIQHQKNMSDNKKIKDTPTCAELLNNTKGVEALSKAVSFFKKIGIKNDKISEAFKKAPDLCQKTDELVPEFCT